MDWRMLGSRSWSKSKHALRCLSCLELTSDNVERAVLQFYQTSATTSPDQLQETHRWLTLAQLSPQVILSSDWLIYYYWSDWSIYHCTLLRHGHSAGTSSRLTRSRRSSSLKLQRQSLCRRDKISQWSSYSASSSNSSMSILVTRS